MFGSLIATLCKLEMYLHRFLVLKTFELDKAINTGKEKLREKQENHVEMLFNAHTYRYILYIYYICLMYVIFFIDI